MANTSVLPISTPSQSQSRRSAGSPPTCYYAILMLVAAVFYVLGKAVTFSVHLDCTRSPAFEKLIEERVEELMRQRQRDAGVWMGRSHGNEHCDCQHKDGIIPDGDDVASRTRNSSHGTLHLQESVDIRTTELSRRDFDSIIDAGVPQSTEQTGDPIIMHSFAASSGKEALERCQSVNVLMVDSMLEEESCTVLLPQPNSLHAQRWHRNDSEGNFHLVSQGFHSIPNSFEPPSLDQTRSSWSLLKRYLDSVDDVLADLRPILHRTAKDSTVVVMVCNHGQVDLLVNFVCSARQRDIDLSNVIVFATDRETESIVSSLGIATYYDHRVSFHTHLVQKNKFYVRTLTYQYVRYLYRTLGICQQMRLNIAVIVNLLP